MTLLEGKASVPDSKIKCVSSRPDYFLGSAVGLINM
jgi:hypothetical protein